MTDTVRDLINFDKILMTFWGNFSVFVARVLEINGCLIKARKLR